MMTLVNQLSPLLLGLLQEAVVAKINSKVFERTKLIKYVRLNKRIYNEKLIKINDWKMDVILEKGQPG